MPPTPNSKARLHVEKCHSPTAGPTRFGPLLPLGGEGRDEGVGRHRERRQLQVWAACLSPHPCPLNLTLNLRACLESAFWVAQASGLCRPATRRPEWGAQRQRIRPAFCWAQPCSFRSAGRPCYPFFKHALNLNLNLNLNLKSFVPKGLRVR